MSFWKIMFGSLADNLYIVIFAVVEVVLLFGVIAIRKQVSKNFDENGAIALKRGVYYILDITYTIFVTIISIFPLLGMFGTVMSLINIGPLFQSETTEMASLQAEFFLALTSTAWGIIFSVFFKIVNAVLQVKTENVIAKAKRRLGL